MTLEAIKARMESLKFRFVPAGSSDQLVGSFFRLTETARPLTDQKDSYLEVEVWDRYRFTRIEADQRYVFDVSLRGEYMKDRWSKLTSYSVLPVEFFEQHRSIETALVRAWEAMKP